MKNFLKYSVGLYEASGANKFSEFSIEFSDNEFPEENFNKLKKLVDLSISEILESKNLLTDSKESSHGEDNGSSKKISKKASSKESNEKSSSKESNEKSSSKEVIKKAEETNAVESAPVPEETPKEEKKAKKQKVSYEPYSRTNEIHRKLFSSFLDENFKGWDSDTTKAATVSRILAGENFLDHMGEMIQEFKDKVIGKMNE